MRMEVPMSRPRLCSLAIVVFWSWFSTGCAGMMAGSHDWFEGKRSDVEPTASADLSCTGKPIEFVAVTMNDYREVEAHGCGKKVRYKYTKVAFVEKWVKSSDVATM